MHNENSKDYTDILFTPWPKKTTRPPMPLENRAKIFLPFAALKGFEEEIHKRKIKADDYDKINSNLQIDNYILKT